MESQSQTKEFVINGNITDGNVSVNSVTYDKKNINFNPNNKIEFGENNQIKLTPDQTEAIKNALNQNTQGGKSKKSYKKRKPKRNTRRTNRK